MGIPFIDLQAQRKKLGDKIEIAINDVLKRGDFIQGQAVREFELKLKNFINSAHVISCANGTDALTLVGMAENLSAGDAVFVPAFTFVASAEAFVILGAVPVFVDVDPKTYNMDADSLRQAIVDAKTAGLHPRMVVGVDLFGQPANYPVLHEIARENNMVLLADAAQSLGGFIGDKRVGTLADYTTTSFFPAKPLGCYGDGGAIFCEDDEKAVLLKSLSQHGKGSEKYDNVRIGLNSRLDSLQAAILSEKLAIFDEELVQRQIIADRYSKALHNVVTTPYVQDGFISAWAQYTVSCTDRDGLKDHLSKAGIPSAIYYPLPLNRQTGYSNFPVVSSGVGVSETSSEEVISLPMHPYLEPDVQDVIIKAVQDFKQ